MNHNHSISGGNNMPREKNQKIKIVRICDLLRNARGIDNALTTAGLISMLADEDIPCDRRTLADNIKVLENYINENDEYDFSICETPTPKGKLYYSENKSGEKHSGFTENDLIELIKGINALSLTEGLPTDKASVLKTRLIDSAPQSSRKKLSEYADDDNDSLLDTVSAQIIIDSINSISVIDRNTADRISNIIIRLADASDREELAKEKSLYRKNTGKGKSLYELDAIRRTISEGKKLSFLYFSLDEKSDRIYHNNGEPIIAQPLHMVQSDDNYYLVCYSDSTETNTKNYRVDRMEKILRINEDISPEAIDVRSREKDYAFGVFRMYSGKEIAVTLSFEDNIIGHIFDKFGEEAHIIRTPDGKCQTTQSIQISPPFWGWLFQFGSAIKILFPDELVGEYKERLNRILNSI